MMQSAENRCGDDGAEPLYGTSQQCILSQSHVGARLIVVVAQNPEN